MFRGCLAGRLYLRDTCENQLSPSCPNSSHSSHVQGTCITSRKAYSRDTRENSLSLQLALSLHTHSLPHTTLTNKSHMKYRVYKIEQNYNQIWQGIKANKNIVNNQEKGIRFWNPPCKSYQHIFMIINVTTPHNRVLIFIL